MKYSALYFVIILVFASCKEKPIKNIDSENPFFTSDEKECFLSEDINNKCLFKKEELSCFKILEKLNQSKIDKIFFNQKWMGNDQQTFFYQVDTKGKIKIYEGGPDVLLEERSLVGNGRIFVDAQNWYYEQSCKDDKCDTLKIQIIYIHCALTKSMNENDALLSIDFGNRELIESDEIENDKSYRLISFIQEKPVPNQIFNFFTSTKVPPIPSQ